MKTEINKKCGIVALLFTVCSAISLISAVAYLITSADGALYNVLALVWLVTIASGCVLAVFSHGPRWVSFVYAVFSSWSGMGWGLPAVLTSETSHSWLTRWHLCLECTFGRTNKNASQNPTFCREQKRAAFPKNPRKSGSKCLG